MGVLVAGWRTLPWCLLAALTSVMLASALHPATGLFHDDGIYLVTAESLAAGDGYRIRSTPGEIVQTKYPPLYPAVLAAIWPLCSGNVVMFKLLSVLFALLWLYAVFRLCSRLGLSRATAAWICVFALSGRWALYLTTAVLPDALFCWLATEAILLLVRVETGGGMRCALLGGAISGAAALTRSLGIALIVTGILALAARRRWRECAAFAVIGTALYSPWMVWQRFQPAPDDRVGAYYTRHSYDRGSLFTLPDLSQKAAVVGLNGAMLLAGSGTLIGLPSGIPAYVIGLVIAGLLLSAVCRSRDGPFTLKFGFVLYCGLLAIWVGPPFRYELPMLPIAGLLIGHLVSRWPRRPAHTAGVFAAILASFCTACTVAAGARSYLQGRTISYAAEDLDDPATLARLHQWIEENTPASTVIAANADPVVFLSTRRKAIRLFAADNYPLLYEQNEAKALGSGADFIEHLQRYRIEYLLLSPMNGFGEGPAFRRLLARAQGACPAFRTVLSESDPRYSIVRVDLTSIARCAMLGK